jgi:hypothetical protein
MVFPYGYMTEGTGVIHGRDSWYHRILSYCDQTPLADLYSQDTTNYVHQITSIVATSVVPMFVCPSDPSSPGRGACGNQIGFQGNYGVCVGTGNTTTVANGLVTVTDKNVTVADPGGMFGFQSKFAIKDCMDGTSNTVLASEGIIRGNPATSVWGELGGYWGGGPHGSYGFSTAEPPNTSVADRVYTCKANSIPGAPNSAPCESGNTLGLVGRWNSARSWHTGGVQATLLDGSVRFVSDNIDRQLWMKVGRRADGQTIGEF